MKAVFLLPALLLLAACGGGGGGGGCGGGGGGGGLVYSGNTSPAVVTATNASELTVSVIGGDDATTIIAGVSAESSSVDVTVPCDSGSIRTIATLNDDCTGTLTVIYNDCRFGNETLSGQGTLRVDAANQFLEPIDFTFSFARLMLRGPSVNGDLSGSLRLQRSIATNTETTTMNIVTLDNITGKMAKAENLVFVDVLFPTSFTETINGRVFDSVHGFVDITTTAPLFFGTLNQLFPDSGQLLLTGAPVGAGNGSILVTALSSTMVKLELDLDGNSVRENTAFLKWTDLSGPVGADLADNDGDGMHNSWETANGLNPNAADATLDKRYEIQAIGNSIRRILAGPGAGVGRKRERGSRTAHNGPYVHAGFLLPGR